MARKIFKPLMKFLEEKEGVSTRNIAFQVLQSIQKVKDMKQQVTDDFSVLQQSNINHKRREQILDHLNRIISGLETRFACWFQLPLSWAALAASDIAYGRTVAQQVLNQLNSNTLVVESIEWVPLRMLLSQPEVREQLSDFAHSHLTFRQCDLLLQFHCKYLIFCTNNIPAERTLAQIYRYTLAAPAALPSRVSAVCRTEANCTHIPAMSREFYWTKAANMPTLYLPESTIATLPNTFSYGNTKNF